MEKPKDEVTEEEAIALYRAGARALGIPLRFVDPWDPDWIPLTEEDAKTWNDVCEKHRRERE
jgi:hypothetical protein